MAQRAVRRNSVAQALLKFTQFWKAALLFAIKKNFTVEANDENARIAARDQRDFRELCLEGRKQFLRGPAGAHQPSTPDAVFDLNARTTGCAFRDRRLGQGRSPFEASA